VCVPMIVYFLLVLRLWRLARAWGVTMLVDSLKGCDSLVDSLKGCDSLVGSLEGCYSLVVDGIGRGPISLVGTFRLER